MKFLKKILTLKQIIVNKKVIKAIMLTNPFFYNIFYNNSKEDSKGKRKYSNSSKKPAIESSSEESTDVESGNEDDKKKDNPKKDPKEKPEKKKELKEEYIGKKTDLIKKFEEYKKIINDKDSNNVSETVSNHLCGFKNYGCTCYFNASMQNLTHNKELVKAILDYVAGITDKGAIDIEIIAFYYLIVKIYKQEKEREKTNNTPVINEELGDLRFFIALKGIDTGKENEVRKDNFLSTSKQSDSQELLNLFIDDLKCKIKSIEDIFYFKTKLNKICTNNGCTENNLEEDKEILSMFKLGLEDNDKEEQIIKIFNKEFKFEEMDEFKCEKCSNNKADDYKKKNSEELKNLQGKFYNCETCKNYFAAKEQYKDKSKIDYKKINIDNIKEYNNDLQFLECKNLKASLREDKNLGLIYNTQCEICKKEYNKLLKYIYIYKKGKQVLLKKVGKYFIMYSNRVVSDPETLKQKKLNKNIVFETSLKLKPKEHGVEREENLGLVGIICQIGTADSGHYISYNKICNKWYLFDDSSVSEVPDNNILNVKYNNKSIQELNYILFYKKQ